MNENRHYENAIAAFSAVNASGAAEFNAECRQDALIEATLAGAYEQRTANLIAWVAAHGEDPSWVTVQIQERLGLA